MMDDPLLRSAKLQDMLRLIAACREWADSRKAIFAGTHTPEAFTRLANAEKTLMSEIEK